MQVDGQCHCGTIRVEAWVNPEFTVLCHCTDCHTISGALYRANVIVKASKMALTGTVKTYVKRADSGADVTTAFCPV